MAEIIMITGGINSGKSDFAEEITLKKSQYNSTNPIYVATSIPYDEEMKTKIRLHIEKRRGKGWHNIQAPLSLIEVVKSDYERINSEYATKKVVLVDCITMLVSNNIFIDKSQFEKGSLSFIDEKDIYSKIDDIRSKILSEIEKTLLEIKKTEDVYLFVTNEIGLGGISGNKMTRMFAQICGDVNKILASKSDEVYMVVSSIPMKIK